MFLISQSGSPLLGRKANQNHFCKIVIFGRCFLGFYFVSNFIVFFQSFCSMFVRFNVRIECEKLVKNCEQKTIHDWPTSGQPTKSHKKPHEKRISDVEESSARRYLTTWPTREKHYQPILLCFIHSFTHTIKAHITHY